MIGKTIAHYQILEKLGEGGMGVVYRARDSQLNRDVALKVLSEVFAQDVERMARFQREAHVLASLNHPNIAAIHGLEESKGIRALVMELVEGSTLAERIAEGPIPLDETLPIARQMAEALEYAHEKGIIHRDLKPANVKVTAEGVVKVLDFGLAKGLEGGTTTGDLQNSPTLTVAATESGVILGTAAYMAPEQARGKAVDRRADIWSFGVVFYEMLTGKRLYGGETVSDTLAAVLKVEPDWDALPQELPAVILRLLRRCLTKDHRERLQAIGDARIEIKEYLSAPASQWQAVLTIPSTQNRWRILSFVLAVVAMSALALGVRGFLVRPQQPEYRQLTFRNGYIQAARFAPDGQTIIYGAAWDHLPIKLYSSRVDGTDIRGLDLPPSELLAVSHSGELATTLDSKTRHGPGNRLARAPLSGGAPRGLLDQVGDADWSPDAAQLAVTRFENDKCRLEYPIGKPLYETFGFISHMRFSPQADAIAFMDHPLLGDDRGTVVLVDLKGNKRTLTRVDRGAGARLVS
jgi:eukaryotic-like serine/threonine-protein kinase